MDSDPEMAVSFRDLKELSIAKANASREALTARGETTSITTDRRVYTQEDYDATIKAAKDRIEKAKERLNVFLSNAGLGAEGGTSANFNFGSVRAVRKDQDIFGKQNILAPEDQSIKSTINTTGFSPLDDEEDQFKSFGDLFGGG